jgi:S1-C subfamily serine protease
MPKVTALRLAVATFALAAVALAAIACTSGAAKTPESATEVASPSAGQALPVSNTSPVAPVATGDAILPLTALDLTADEIVAAQEQLLGDIYDRVVPSVVRIVAEQGATSGGEGSGFVWDTQGHIVTNYHVVQGATGLTVFFYDGSEYSAEVVGNDPNGDLAVIKVDAPASVLKPLALGSSKDVKPGQMTIAIGNPFGEDFTMTTGIVSAIGRLIDSGFTSFDIPSVVQTDAAINPGNSGGPLLDRQGRVIGINTQIRSETRQSSGVGFAVPVDLVKRVAPSLIARGRYEYAYLGVRGGPVTEQAREGGNLPSGLRGAILDFVAEGEPAGLAGLKQDTGRRNFNGVLIEPNYDGDVVTAIKGTSIRSMNDLISYLALNTSPGDTVEFTVFRGGQEIQVDVTLGTRPR